MIWGQDCSRALNNRGKPGKFIKIPLPSHPMQAPKTVEKQILIQAPASAVWEVLTRADKMQEWLSDLRVEVVSDWEKGSPILFNSRMHGKSQTDKGIILDLQPNKLFSYSLWTPISRVPDIPENYSIITFELEPQENGTLLRLSHSQLTALASFEHSNYYWGITLTVIKKMVEGL